MNLDKRIEQLTYETREGNIGDALRNIANHELLHDGDHGPHAFPLSQRLKVLASRVDRLIEECDQRVRDAILETMAGDDL